jgi:hypothetical protein
MQRRVLVLLLGLVAANALAPSSFVETKAGAKATEPFYPPFAAAPMPCAILGAHIGGVGGAVAQTLDGHRAAVAVQAGGPQVVLQSNAVDVETDGGFVISLPSPPPLAQDLPEYAEDRPGSSAMNRVIRRQRQKISRIRQLLAVKKQALTEHDQWLEQAKRAIERVKRQMQETRLSRSAIRNRIKGLEEQQHAEIVATKRQKLAKELEETRAKLNVLTEQHAQVVSAKDAISRKRRRVSHSILGLGKQLKWHNDKLKNKIQFFEDQENDLGQIGQTPRSITKIDRIFEDQDEARMDTI